MLEGKIVYQKILPRGRFVVFNQKPEIELSRVKQIHSNIVLSGAQDGLNEADGIVDEGSRPLAILTADCLPIVLLGLQKHAIIHAGWRGLHSQILRSPLLKEISPYYAFIGPHICVKHYEVQNDFKSNFQDKDSYLEENNQLYFNLERTAQKQLKSLFTDIKIESAQLCTLEHDELHSFRRNKTEKRNWNIYFP